MVQTCGADLQVSWKMRHCNCMGCRKGQGLHILRKHMRRRYATLALLLPLAFLNLRFLCAQKPTQDPLLRWMDQIAQQQLQRREDAIAKIRTVADAERRKQSVRETLLSLIGGLPDYNGPLNPRITGRIQAENYTIEKVIFESLPGFYVTANLYRPNQPGRYPGILLQAGHTQEGKPEGQRLAANLALKGFVVLAFDPVGQGEREQTYDRRVDRALAGWSVPEHIQAGAQSLLDRRERGPLFHLGCQTSPRLSGQPSRSGRRRVWEPWGARAAAR